MKTLEQGLDEIVRSIWFSMLGFEVRRTGGGPGPGAGLQASVDLEGDWRGRLDLVCPEDLARRAAAVLFRLPADEVSPEQASDALGELANMAAGNLKPLLDSSCTLSRPRVAPAGPRELRALCDLSYACDDRPFRVVLQGGRP